MSIIVNSHTIFTISLKKYSAYKLGNLIWVVIDEKELDSVNIRLYAVVCSFILSRPII